METNVSTLLREFPRIRRTALSGERVVIRTREGDLWITAAPSEAKSAIGFLKGAVKRGADDIDTPTTTDSEWKASL